MAQTPNKSLENNFDPFEVKLLEESKHLCNFLPEDVWLLIMNELANSPGDLERLTNSSPYFRKLYLPKRVQFLFPKVLDKTLPKLLDANRNRELSVFLNLRAVCHSWNNAVDNFIYSGSNYLFSISRKFLQLEQSFKSFSPQTLIHFLEHFEQSHSPSSKRSPFVSRNVSIWFHYAGMATVPEFTVGVTMLLENYGHHLRSLQIYLPRDLPYSKLREWILPMRKLKHLNLEHMHPIPVDLLELEAQLRQFPLPNFKYLERLRTRHIPSLFVNELIRRSSQISELVVVGTGLLNEYYDFFTVPLPNLKTFKTDSFNSSDVFELGRSPQAAQWPLNNLKIEYISSTFISWFTMFKIIQNNWGGTLQSLSLHLPEGKGRYDAIKILIDSSTFRLNLPKLRNLDLTIHNRCNFDFLLPMKGSLEGFRVEMRFSVDDPCKRDKIKDELAIPATVQLLGYEDRMLESNIWNLFPRLDIINLSEVRPEAHYVYLRQQ